MIECLDITDQDARSDLNELSATLTHLLSLLSPYDDRECGLAIRVALALMGGV